MKGMNNFGHKQVLVVDDEASIRGVLRRALTEEGYTVTLAADGDEALEAVARQEFEVILLDIGMPRLSGLQVLALLKAERSEAYVVMTTAFADADTIVKAMKVGAFDYITKPFTINKVQETVKEAREKRCIALMAKTRESDFREIVSSQAREMRLMRTNTIKELAGTI